MAPVALCASRWAPLARKAALAERGLFLPPRNGRQEPHAWRAGAEPGGS